MNLTTDFKNYLQNQKNPASKVTIKNYISDINKFIRWYELSLNREFSASEIDSELINSFRQDSLSKYSASSVERSISTLRKFFTFLRIDGKISHSPFEAIENAARENNVDPWRIRDFKNYLYVLNASNLTIKNYIIDIKQFKNWLESTVSNEVLDTFEANYLVSIVNSRLINDYKNRLLNDLHFSPLSVNRKLSSLRRYFSWAVNEGIINQNIQVLNEPKLNDKIFVPLSSQPPTPKPDEIAQNYSKIPPFRVAQKTKNGFTRAIDLLLIAPVAYVFSQFEDILWLAEGKPVFEDSPKQAKQNSTRLPNPLSNSQEPIKNIPKSFYAPTHISTANFPLHKKAWHIIRYSRPNWYRKYHSYTFTSYLHFSILMLTVIFFSYAIFKNLEPKTQVSVLGSAQSPSIKSLSFKGKITDANGKIINNKTNLRMAIYKNDTATGSALLWQEVISTVPNSNGEINVTLGNNNPIPQNLLFDNSALWLGISVESTKELAPRERIATSSLAENSKSLLGLTPITNSDQTSSVILALNSTGNLIIGDDLDHTFQVTDGNFILSGKTLVLTTTPNSNGNIRISPDGAGVVDIQKVIKNTTKNGLIVQGAVEIGDILNINSSSTNQSVLNINQGSTGDLLIANASGNTKFRVDNFGNISSGDINGLVIKSASITSGTWDAKEISPTRGGTGITSYSSGDILFADANNTLTKLAIGSSGNCLVSNGGKPTWSNCYTNPNTGIFKLDVSDDKSSSASAQIYNSNNGTDADGLIIKLGNNSSTSVSTSNHFINFETAGIGIVGSIQGNNGKNVAYVTNGVADFAEYMQKDPDELIEWGSLVCINASGIVENCNTHNSTKLIGIASEFPTFVGGENQGNKTITVGLNGIVSAQVSAHKGSIQAGDYITYSSIPGVGTKASNAGQMIGIALSSFDGPGIGKIQVRVNPSWHNPNIELTDSGQFALKPTADNNFEIKDNSNKIIISTEIYSELITSKLKAGYLELGRLTVATANITYANINELGVDSIALTTDNLSIAGQNIRDYIYSIVDERIDDRKIAIASPILETDQIKPANSNNLSIKLPGNDKTFKVEILNASDSAVATIDAEGNASFSGKITANESQVSKLNSQSLETNDASISGTLRAGRIIADQIDLSEEALAKYAGFNTSSSSSNITNNYYYNSIPSNDPSTSLASNYFPQSKSLDNNLTAIGPTSFFEISVLERLFVGSQLSFADRSINVLGGNLEIQPLKQGGINFLGGLIEIDIDGNLKVDGNAYFAKNLEVNGKLFAELIAPIPGKNLIIELGDAKEDSNLIIQNSSRSGVLTINNRGDLSASGSGSFSKLNLNFIPKAIAVNDTVVIASGSAGTAEIKPYQNELTVLNPLVTKDSLIYITVKTDLDEQGVYLLRQVPENFDTAETEGSFTVGISKVLNKSVPFNWILIN